MQKTHLDKITVLAVVLLAVVLVGECLTYAPGVHRYDASAEWENDTVRFTASSNGSNEYDAVLINHGNIGPVEKLYVFVDESYDRFYKDACRTSSPEYIDQQYYAEQIVKGLGIRGFDDVILCDSEELSDLIRNTMDNPEGIGLIVTSFSLPSSVYTGVQGDPILEWVSSGGKLYWHGSEIGKFYLDGETLNEVSDNQILIFGAECINVDGPRNADAMAGEAFTESLSLKNSNIRFSMDTDVLGNGLEMGYSRDGYASASLTSIGGGEIGVFGGGFDVNQIDDICQIIAAGITSTSTVSGHESGEVTRGTIEGSMIRYQGDDRIYIYIGGTYMVFGGAFSV